MIDQLNSENNAMFKIWASREKQICTVLKNIPIFNMLRNPVLNQRAEQNHFKVKTSFEGVSMLRNPEAAARFVRTL